MARDSVLIFLIFLAILHTAYCASVNDSFDPFGPKNPELKSSEHSGEKEYFYDNEIPSNEKLLAKRRLFFNEDDVNHGLPGSESTELARRKTNFSEEKKENQVSGYQHAFSNLQNRENRFHLPTSHSRYNPEIRGREPLLGQKHFNSDFNWQQRDDVFEKTQTVWNEEKDFKQIPHNTYDPRFPSNYNGRPLGIFNDGPNVNIYPNKKISITTYDDLEMNEKKFNDGRDGEMNPGYLAHRTSNYYNRNMKGSWNPNFYRPEKGVIINFNSECVPPRQLNNQLMQKVFYTPKAPFSPQREITTYPIPETALISPQKITPMYYL